MRLHIFLWAFFTHAFNIAVIYCQDSLEDAIRQVFGNGTDGSTDFSNNYAEVTPAPLQDVSNLTSCETDDAIKKYCVRYYDCDKTTNTIHQRVGAQTPSTTEVPMFDIRFKEDSSCSHYLEVCCKAVVEQDTNQITSEHVQDRSPIGDNTFDAGNSAQTIIPNGNQQQQQIFTNDEAGISGNGFNSNAQIPDVDQQNNQYSNSGQFSGSVPVQSNGYDGTQSAASYPGFQQQQNTQSITNNQYQPSYVNNGNTNGQSNDYPNTQGSTQFGAGNHYPDYSTSGQTTGAGSSQYNPSAVYPNVAQQTGSSNSNPQYASNNQFIQSQPRPSSGAGTSQYIPNQNIQRYPNSQISSSGQTYSNQNYPQSNGNYNSNQQQYAINNNQPYQSNSAQQQQQQSAPVCGVRNPLGVEFQITGNNDNEAQFAEFPWMVAILHRDYNKYVHDHPAICGGSLITPIVVLTTAHCIRGMRPSAVKIRAGEWDTQTVNEPIQHQERNVLGFLIHDQYDPKTLANDIALLILDRQLVKTASVGAVCLPQANQHFQPYTNCFATGWGKNVFGQQGRYSVILKKIELPLVDHSDCEAQLRNTRLGQSFQLHKSFTCAGGEEGRDTCTGDGGSPLVCQDPENPRRYFQVGMVAWGIGCGQNDVPGVYVDVAHFRQWIDQKLVQYHISRETYMATF